MGEILRDRSAESLVVAIRANMREWLRYIGSSPQAELYEGPELTWLLTGTPTPTLNTVMRTEAEPANTGALIEETLAHFRSKGVPRFSWWVGPDTRPADLGQHLASHDLTYHEGPAGMAADLLELTEDSPVPAGLMIEHVQDTKALEAWIRASFSGFGFPGTDTGSGFGLFAGLGFDLPLRSYLGTLDGEPVAASQLFLGAGVAGIYIVATIPDARGQGIGTALTLAALRDARAVGFRIGILHASPMGLGIYRRLGFREYCRMSSYLYQEGGPGRREQ
jgi:GNAT superfamily N-acetyltransferase